MKKMMGLKLSIMLTFLLFSLLFFTYNVSAEKKPLNVGETYDIMSGITNVKKIVSITCSNDDVVSVDSNGVVTAIQPGTSNVIIEYLDDTNQGELLITDFKVDLATGYYRIKNKETGRYLSLGNIKSKKDPSVYLSSYNDEGTLKLCQVWHVVKKSDLYEIKPYLDENAILNYSMVFDDVRISKMFSYEADSIYDQLNSWYIDGDEIFNRYGGYANGEYGGKRLSRSAFSSNSNSLDTWVFEVANELSSGIRLIDEYYDIDSVNARYMAIGSTKSLEDFKIRLLRYSTNSLLSPVWSSNNINVATVDESTGEVTATGVGTAVITVTQQGLISNNTASYTINVLPFRDGLYSFVNRLGFDALEPISIDGEIYLKRASNTSNISLWYMQTTIDGEYLISSANNKNVLNNYMLGCRELYDDFGEYTGTCASLMGLTDSIFDLPTWSIKNNELGYSFEFEGDANSSMFILDSQNSLVELGAIDYEDYEGMWNINEIVAIDGKSKLYLHPYYDEEFVELFASANDTINAVNSYIEETKRIFEKELGVEVEVFSPEFFSTAGIDNLDDMWLYRRKIINDISEIESLNPYYRNSHKYIIYSGHDFPSANISGADKDIAIIAAYEDRDSNGMADNDCILTSTIHETAHLLGGLDHYHMGNNCTRGEKCTTCGSFRHKRAEDCIMHFENYDREHPFCNDCRMEMIMNVNSKCIE